MDTTKKIYEGWAEEKYCDNQPTSREVEYYDTIRRKAYTAALEERLPDVSLKFAMYCVVKELWVIDETVFTNWLNNIYGK